MDLTNKTLEKIRGCFDFFKEPELVDILDQIINGKEEEKIINQQLDNFLIKAKKKKALFGSSNSNDKNNNPFDQIEYFIDFPGLSLKASEIIYIEEADIINRKTGHWEYNLLINARFIEDKTVFFETEDEREEFLIALKAKAKEFKFDFI